jgi:solute carrier family 13 (sodium-dependent dicarboxylate transporter), member 2/3/5
MLKANQKYLGLVTGIVLFLVMQFVSAISNIDGQIRNTASIVLLMASWWLTEAIPLAATALMPLALFPLFKIVPAKQIALAYADSNIFLFMGGFLIAMAMQRHNLHKRIALSIISLMGTSSRKILLGFMVATAFLSMWISNTATAMMMIPIAIAIVEQFKAMEPNNENIVFEEWGKNFGIALMLGIAYSSSIGGIGTLIGTPPNLVFSSVLKSTFPELPEIDFIRWMLIGIPVVVVFLPFTWLYLSFIGTPLKSIQISDSKKIMRRELMALGKMGMGEKLTLAVFILTSIGWIFRKDIELGSFNLRGWGSLTGIGDYVNDSTVAMFGALLLFILPTSMKKVDFVLNWEWAKKIPWGILVLFGGGLALSEGFKQSGLDLWIGKAFSSISNTKPIVLIISICLLLTFLTEITSNIATISMFLPILAAMSLSLHVNPLSVMIPATISASCAFMMPVATPPNAIVFGSGYLTIQDMAKMGLAMNLAGVIIITLLMYLVAFPLLGITFF